MTWASVIRRLRSNSRLPTAKHYRPAPGVARYLCGTQPVISLSALECGLDTLLAAEPFNADFGSMAALRTKSLALTDAFIALVERAAPAASRSSRRTTTPSAARRCASRWSMRPRCRAMRPTPSCRR